MGKSRKVRGAGRKRSDWRKEREEAQREARRSEVRVARLNGSGTYKTPLMDQLQQEREEFNDKYGIQNGSAAQRADAILTKYGGGAVGNKVDWLEDKGYVGYEDVPNGQELSGGDKVKEHVKGVAKTIGKGAADALVEKGKDLVKKKIGMWLVGILGTTGFIWLGVFVLAFMLIIMGGGVIAALVVMDKLEETLDNSPANTPAETLNTGVDGGVDTNTEGESGEEEGEAETEPAESGESANSPAESSQDITRTTGLYPSEVAFLKLIKIRG